MTFAASKAELIEEFPELGLDDVLLQKELYAHFGLLFFKFALVEHSLINISTFSHVGSQFHSGNIRSKNQWEASFDSGYKKACDLTFGNLIQRAIREEEFSHLESKLSELKTIRDYFTHRFFREEILHFSDDQLCWQLLVELAKLRHSTIAVERLLEAPFSRMCERYGIPTPSKEQVDEQTRIFKEKDINSLKGSKPSYGWK